LDKPLNPCPVLAAGNGDGTLGFVLGRSFSMLMMKERRPAIRTPRLGDLRAAGGGRHLGVRGARLDARPRRSACPRARPRRRPSGSPVWRLSGRGCRRGQGRAGLDRRHLPGVPARLRLGRLNVGAMRMSCRPPAGELSPGHRETDPFLALQAMGCNGELDGRFRFALGIVSALHPGKCNR